MPRNVAARELFLESERVFDRNRFANSLWISFGIHLFLVVILIVGIGDLSWRRKLIDLDESVVWTDLKMAPGKGASAALPIVGAAEDRRDQLPAAPVVKTLEPKQPSQEVVRHLEKPAVKNPPKEAVVEPSAEELAVREEAKRRAAMRSALSNLRHDVSTSGAPSSAEKDKNQQSLAASTQAQLFRQQIKKRIESHLHVTDYDWFGQYRERVVEYWVDVDAQGAIVDIKLKRSSGVSSMDQAVMRAIRDSEPYYAPNEELRTLYADVGINVRFTPKDLEP